MWGKLDETVCHPACVQDNTAYYSYLIMAFTIPILYNGNLSKAPLTLFAAAADELLHAPKKRVLLLRLRCCISCNRHTALKDHQTSTQRAHDPSCTAAAAACNIQLPPWVLLLGQMVMLILKHGLPYKPGRGRDGTRYWLVR